MLGVILLPSDYRAGAERAHAHSLLQLWIDASDGVIQHHINSSLATHPQSHDWVALTSDEAEDTQEHADCRSCHSEPDVGDQQDSTPTLSEVQLMLAASILLPIMAKPPVVGARSEHRLSGQTPRVLLPPPRWGGGLNPSLPRAGSRPDSFTTSL